MFIIMRQRKFYWYMRMYNICQLIYTPALKFVLCLSFDIYERLMCVCVYCMRRRTKVHEAFASGGTLSGQKN